MNVPGPGRDSSAYSDSPPPEQRGLERDDLLHRVEHLAIECARLDQRLLRVEASIFIRAMRTLGSAAISQKKRLGQKLRASPLHPLYRALARPQGMQILYAAWVLRQEAAYPPPEWHRLQAAGWPYQPRISILITQPDERATASIRNQSYENWELCVSQDHSASALNAAAQSASGEYIALMEGDAVLHPYALHYAAEALQSGDVQALYTAEDRLDSRGSRTSPLLKPDWSPELLMSCMYWGHLLIAQKAIIERAGWFRPGYEGALDYDLALRMTDRPMRVKHVPRVLYHRPASPVPSGSEAAALRALRDTVERRRIPGAVQPGPLPHTYFIRRETSEAGIATVICTRNASMLRRCLNAIARRTAYPHREIVVVRHRQKESGRVASVAESFGARCVNYDGKFDFSAMCNLGAEHARAGMLLFLNDDTEPLRPDWLETLVAHLERPEIGIAGGKLLYPNGAIQHAGVAVTPDNVAWHIARGVFRSDLFPWLELPREVSAVTGACLAIRRRVFEDVGRFDSAFPVNYNDVDLCLRVRQLGLNVLCDPRVLLRHRESATRFGGTTFQERWRFYEKWRHVNQAGDPYYPPVFDYWTEEVRLKG